MFVPYIDTNIPAIALINSRSFSKKVHIRSFAETLSRGYERLGSTSYRIAEKFAEPPAYVVRITPYDLRVSESLLSNKAYMLRHFGYRWNIGSKQHTARCLAIRNSSCLVSSLHLS